MLNPILGRNLGRWANVYFTSPPEKREEAVLELLRQLEAEAGDGESTGPVNGHSNNVVAEARMAPEPHMAAETETVMCAECGHRNAKAQRFCGMCGSSLTLENAPFSGERPSAKLRPLAEPAERTIEPEEPVRETAFPTLSLFAQAREETSSTSRRGSDIQWLSDQDLEEEPGLSPALKYVLLLLAIFLAGAFYYNRAYLLGTKGPGEQSASGVWTGNGTPSRSAPAPSIPNEQTQENVNARGPDTDPKATPTPTLSTPKEADPRQPNVRSHDSGDIPSSLPSNRDSSSQMLVRPTAQDPAAAPQESAATTNGAAELAMAEDYLTGKRGPRNSVVAATFLWKAVSKENTTATLLLSDLYRTGDGVPKSCDQARVLLYAAARKNIPEAGRKLRDLQAGCP